MNTKLKQKFNEIEKNLPRELRESMNAWDWEEIVKEIGGENFLIENSIEDLQLETAFILTGMEDANIFSLNIETEVGTSKERAEKIAKEIDEKVFKPIYEKLEEKIKQELKNKKISWKQNLDFVLSGGDYTLFLTAEEGEPNIIEPTAIQIRTDFIKKKEDNNFKGKFNI